MGWTEPIGSRLDRYEILELIGHGGSSRVYRAYDPERPGDVAIKAILNDAEDRQSFVARFRQEVAIVSKLRHPNIIEIYGSGDTGQIVYLVMQCVWRGKRNNTLRYQFTQNLTLAQSITYIRQMARALHYAHQQRIVHRDVKPSNMLVDPEHPEQALLTDFGIAKIQGHRGLTKSGTTIGTPEYMSPEQAEGLEVDHRADIYALGCVLYEALAGRPPFVGATPVSVLYQHVHTRAPYIRGFNPDVPRDLAALLERALQKDPADRFETAEAFAVALEPFLHESQRIAANRMTEPFRSPDELSEQGFLPDADIFGTGPDGAAAAQDALPLFPPANPLQDSDAGLELPPAGDHSPLPLPQAGAPPSQDDVTTLPGRWQTRRNLPPGPLRLPARGNEPQPPEIAADAGRSPLEAGPPLLAGSGVDIADLPTAPPAGRPRPGQTRPVHGPRPSVEADARPFAEMARARAEAPVAVGEPPVWPGPEDDWGPATDEIPTQAIAAPRRPRSRRGRTPVVAALALAAVALAGVAALLGHTAYDARNTATPPSARSHVTPTAAPSATPSPTVAPTATARATATPTTNPNAALIAEAQNSFRAMYLGTFEDLSCSPANSVAQFTPGQPIYANLCTSGTVAPGQMTAIITQNGATVWTLSPPTYLSPDVGYSFHTYKYLSPGSYTVFVDMDINGAVVAAGAMSFTVG